MTIPRANDPMGMTVTPSREILISSEPPLRPPGDISAVSLVNVILRHRMMILLLGLVFGLYAGAKSVTSPKTYTTEMQFMPKGARGQASLGGLAAQLGVTIGGGGEQSPQLYTDLLETRSLLWPVAQKTYRIRGDSGEITGDLVRIFRIRNPRPEVVRARVVNSLKGAIKANLATKTGVITATVTTGNPQLSLQIAQNLLEQVNVYNLTRRQEQAAAERGFAERQVDEKRSELRAAEQQMETFLETNRLWRSSPQLSLEYNRLTRAVDMRNQIYTSLLQSYETARIEEVRDLPVITVIEAPEIPLDADARGGLRKTLIGILVGIVLGGIIAFFRDRMARNKASQSDEFIEFDALKRETLGDLTHPWRPVTRAFGSRRKT